MPEKQPEDPKLVTQIEAAGDATVVMLAGGLVGGLLGYLAGSAADGKPPEVWVSVIGAVAVPVAWYLHKYHARHFKAAVERIADIYMGDVAKKLRAAKRFADQAEAERWNPGAIQSHVRVSLGQVNAHPAPNESIGFYLRFWCPCPLPFLLHLKEAEVVIEQEVRGALHFAHLARTPTTTFDGFSYTREREYRVTPAAEAKGLLTEMRAESGYVRIIVTATYEIEVSGDFCGGRTFTTDQIVKIKNR